ncbi:MAG: glycosyltransferase family 61 protein [Chthoniobacteraceae bacterium]|nr:glycosyltransferase family 61 protein [Chthoniobacteraceae bacterium]
MNLLTKLASSLRYHFVDPSLRRIRRILPSSGRWQGPATGRYLNHADLPGHPLVDYREIYPAGRIAWSDLKLDPAEAAEVAGLSHDDDWTNAIRPGFLAVSRRMRYTSFYHTLLTETDDVYGGLQFPHVPEFGPKSHPLFTHPRQPPLDPAERGRALVFLGMPNLYHFLFEAVARLALAREAGMDLRSYAHFISEPPSAPFQMEILEHLGIPAERFLPPSGAAAHCRFSELHFSNATYGISPDLVRILRAFLGSLPRRALPFPAPEKIYLSRAAYPTRRLLNEPEISEQLARRGFTTVFPHELSFAQQRVLFEGARVIVSSHGAGLANCLWCRPGTKIVEFRSNAHSRGYWKLYWNLSGACGLEHRWVTCEEHPNPNAAGAQYADLLVPPERLAACLDS